MKPFITRYFSFNTILLSLILFAGVPTSFANETTATTNQKILVVGDSLSAAYGIRQEQGWVHLLQQYLSDNKTSTYSAYQVINASISGETTGGALARLPKLLTLHQPNIIIIELGGNDGLRGYPINILRSNLEQLVRLSKQAQASVLITGIRIPPNYGQRYTQLFSTSYQLIAQKYQATLVPFLLDDVAIHPQLMQADGIHPTAEAQAQILQNVLPYLKRLF